MITYNMFREIQPFFENVRKKEFDVCFGCKETGVLNIRIFGAPSRMKELKELFNTFLRDINFGDYKVCFYVDKCFLGKDNLYITFVSKFILRGR